ncbi:hypothetical protein KAT73_00945 [candidate division WOR-3 bacterium]|nr:hypothetical protein [candidate division WOR-3 bacterium]
MHNIKSKGLKVKRKKTTDIRQKKVMRPDGIVFALNGINLKVIGSYGNKVCLVD